MTEISAPAQKINIDNEADFRYADDNFFVDLTKCTISLNMEAIMGVKHLNEIPTRNQKLIKWVVEWAELCKPQSVHWCDGTPAEYDRLMGEMVDSGLGTRHLIGITGYSWDPSSAPK